MKLTFRKCKGLFARGTADNCPPDYLLRADNVRSKGENILPRFGFQQFDAINAVNHMAIYNPPPTGGGDLAPKLIYQRKDIDGGFWEIINYDDTPNDPIHFATEQFFSWINFFGRGYFTVHNTIVGAEAKEVQVYEGAALNSGLSRNIAGNAPTSTMAGAAGIGGNLGVGKYLFKVCFVTSSGFQTQPSEAYVDVDCFGGYDVDLTSIPTGGAGTGTVARQIVGTKAIPLGTFTGNPNDYEFFNIPDGFINDNSTTTLNNLSYFDGDLSDSVEDLMDILADVPAGVGIGEYNGRMMVWGEEANPSIIRFSLPGEPESFSESTGFIIVDPTESGGVKNCIVLRGTLYICKADRIFVTTDNGGDPSTWPIAIFDAGIGTEPYGLSQILDSKGTHLNQYLIAAKAGLILFDGILRTPELTYWVEDIWMDIDPDEFSKVQVVQNPKYKHIYVIFTRNDAENYLLFGDYSNGLNIDNIKWFLWSTDLVINSAVIRTDPALPIVYLGTDEGIYSFDPVNPSPLDANDSFEGVIRTPILVTDGQETNIQEITEVTIRQKNGQASSVRVQFVSAEGDQSHESDERTWPFQDIQGLQERADWFPFVDLMPTLVITLVSDALPQTELSRVSVDGTTYGADVPH